MLSFGAHDVAPNQFLRWGSQESGREQADAVLVDLSEERISETIARIEEEIGRALGIGPRLGA